MSRCGECVSHNRAIRQTGPAEIGRCMDEKSRLYGIATNVDAGAQLSRCGAFVAGEPRRYTLTEDIAAMEAANERLRRIDAPVA